VDHADSNGFLGRSKVARWVEMVCMAKKLLYHQTSMLAQVYVHFCALIVACTKQVSRAPVHVQVCTLYRCLLTSVYISGNTPSSDRARALVYAHFVHSRWGTSVGRFS